MLRIEVIRRCRGHVPEPQQTQWQPFKQCVFHLARVPAINVAFKGCDDGLIQKDNSISEYNQNSPGMVIEPQLSFDPRRPQTLLQVECGKSLQTETKGATIRYTLDGSRPTEESPLIDGVAGIKLPWPGPATNVNARFQGRPLPSITNGARGAELWIRRQAPGAGTAGPGGHSIGDVAGNVDSFVAAEATVRGWAVDSALPKEDGHLLLSSHLWMVAAFLNSGRPKSPRFGECWRRSKSGARF